MTKPSDFKMGFNMHAPPHLGVRLRKVVLVVVAQVAVESKA